MPTYVSLINWTEQGVSNYKDSPKRAQAFTQMVEQMGGKVLGIYWTIGPYDLVAISEVPDDETYTAAALKVSAIGNVRTTSLRAYTEKEFKKVLDKTG